MSGLLDSLVHATPDGRWFNTAHDAGLDTLLRQMDASGVERAMLVGLAGIIDNGFVLDSARRHCDRLIACAGFDPSKFTDAGAMRAAARALLSDQGFPAVKLHSRLGGYDLLAPLPQAFLAELSDWTAPPVLLVDTFLHHGAAPLAMPPVETLHTLAVTFPGLRFVFLHGAGIEIVSLMEALRSCENALIDMSYTLHLFQGTPLIDYLAMLTRRFDRRLTWGSDFPEVSLMQARSEIDALLAPLDSTRRTNILGENLGKWFSLEQTRSIRHGCTET